jgi:DNA-binding LacI/PurR family transcriptional regulator
MAFFGVVFFGYVGRERGSANRRRVKASGEPSAEWESLRGRVYCAYRCASGRMHLCASRGERRALYRNRSMAQIQTVKMAQIAQQLGVNVSTISRALRGDPRIGAAMREQVRQVSEKMDYRPNPLISALMANRRRRGGKGEVDVIALVTNYGGRDDWRTKDVCRWEYQGIEKRAAELGFRIEIFSLREYRGDLARLVSTIRARGIRGVLLGFARDENEPGTFPVENFAVAGLSAYFRSTRVDRANFHGFFNVQLALDRIATLGYRRPALIVPDLNNRISNNLWSGAFLDWQRRVPKRDRCEPYIPAGDGDPEEFNGWLTANRPDALLVYKVPVRSYLAIHRRHVPDDLGLAYLYRTSDEMGGAAGIDGNLSAVGAAALDLVVEKLNTNRTGVSEHPKEVLIQGTWYEGATLPRRETSAAPRRKSARVLVRA